MKTYLITGANRGIGLALTQQLLTKGEKIIATARNPSGAVELNQLKKVHGENLTLLTLDLSKPHEVEQNLKRVGPIDVLINNAGILMEYSSPLSKLSLDRVLEMFQVNVIGTIAVTRTLMGLVKGPRPLIATLSSKVGSIADNTSGAAYGYRMSKTALNMFNKSLSWELRSVICLALHPGWVRTEMGGKEAPTLPEESAKGLIDFMEKATLKHSGRFFDFRGEEIPW